MKFNCFVVVFFAGETESGISVRWEEVGRTRNEVQLIMDWTKNADENQILLHSKDETQFKLLKPNRYSVVCQDLHRVNRTIPNMLLRNKSPDSTLGSSEKCQHVRKLLPPKERTLLRGREAEGCLAH